jgi:predicted subunit of tRNA(5-methylaminomethyl-2-thiouridylate) methyltransferase
LAAGVLITGLIPRTHSECEIEYRDNEKSASFSVLYFNKIIYNPHMQSITFITGNQKKADYLAKYLGFPIEHIKLDLDEIQSLSLAEIVEHKAKQAYTKVGKPVIVEDVSLEFSVLGRLP